MVLFKHIKSDISANMYQTCKKWSIFRGGNRYIKFLCHATMLPGCKDANTAQGGRNVMVAYGSLLSVT